MRPFHKVIDMEIIDIRDKVTTFTDVILRRFAEDVFFSIGMQDSWSREVKLFAEENYRTHKDNYESLHKEFQGESLPTKPDQLEIQSIITILQFFPPVKEFYKKTSAQAANESFEKTIKDIGTLRNTLALYDSAYDRDGKKLYFMQFIQLINLQKLAVMCIEHLEETRQWIDILDWTASTIEDLKLHLRNSKQ